MKGLAAFCYDKRRIVVVGWIMLVIGLFGLSTAFKGEFKTDFTLPGSESQNAFDLLRAKGAGERSGFSGQVVFRSDNGVNDPAVRVPMEAFFADIESALREVRIASPYQPENAYQISQDGKIAYAQVNFSERKQEEYFADAKSVKELHKKLAISGLQVELGGDIFADFPDFSTEGVGVLAAIFIMLIAFGSLLAMGLPLVTALVGIGCGVALIGLVTRFLSVPDFTSQVALMIGLGVGIDYALMIVTRYRTALHDGMDPREATITSIDTSGRAVLFAGTTVVISLLGIFMMNLDAMRSMAVGAVLAVLMTMLASVTLLPALLGFVGRHIDRLSLPHIGRKKEQVATRTFWYRWSRLIQAHPWPALVISLAVLLALAAPLYSVRLGFSDSGNRSAGDTTRRAYDLLSQGFGPGFNAPIIILVEQPGGQPSQATVASLKGAIEGTEGVQSVAGPIPVADGALMLLTIFPTTAPQDKETADLVHRLREQTIPPVMAGTGARALATGAAPAVVDFSDYNRDRLPLFVGAVLLLSFLLLVVVFHSVVVPLKAVVMNLLSIGAAFGAMVAVFQWGYLGSVFGLGKAGPIEAWAPMMLFAIIFGLSMDYEVFLLARIREEYDRTGDNSRAVADGLATTGRVISAAALIMVCVFGSFLLVPERVFKLLGFGLAFAVLIDATVVRLVLVPAVMELMGKANWWAPSWLARMLPRMRVDSAPEVVPTIATTGA